MRGLNKVILIGRLGKDPEVRESQSGTAKWGSFSLATHRGVRRGDQWQEETDWHRITCFGALAERCGSFLQKGALVAVEGSVQNDNWTTEEGTRRYSTTIIADGVTFLEPAMKETTRAEHIDA